MSDLSNVSTPGDLVKLNDEPQGVQVEIGTDPEKDLEIAKAIIAQIYEWHVSEADKRTEKGEHDSAKLWAQDAGILHTVYETLNHFEC